MKTGFRLSLASGLVFVSITCLQLEAPGFAKNDSRIGKPATPNSLELLPVSNPRRPTELEQTYIDSFSILKYENSCSQFFGGPLAITALNDLTRQIRPTHLDRRIGIRMTGPTTMFTSFVTNFSYRLFERAEVNLDGPFYRPNGFSPRGKVPRIGPFEPSTREARVTTVLHELGHLIRRPDGQWVLPNDGEDLGASEENTRRVVAVCGEQIRALHNFTFEQELLSAQAATRAGSTVLERSPA